MTTATANGHRPAYDPEQYLPPGPEEWRGRIADLVRELRNPELEPGSGHLYRQEENGPMTACVEGVINEMAIRGGLPAFWFDFEDDDNATVWDAEQPDRDGTEPFGYRFVDAANVAIPEALLYHGLSVAEGRHVVDILECDSSFIRSVINDRHGVALGADTLPGVNDRLLKDGANPLHVMADVFEHLLEKPAAGSWHPRVNRWA